MLQQKKWAVGTGRLFFIFLALCLLCAIPARAQRFFHVDEVTKTVYVVTVQYQGRNI